MKKPIVHAFFLCYNEAMLLPHLIKHYSTFCEKITILDNNSTDNSVEIINSFPNTEVIPYNSKGEYCESWLLKLKNHVWKSSIGFADYVIVGDSDEFLYHENIEQFLIDSFAKGVTIFKPEGYHMVADETLNLSPDDNILELVKYGVRTHVLDKMMMFDCNKISSINFSVGCHSANPTGQIVLSNDSSLKMLHYKFLGLENHIYKNKIRAERLSDFNKINGFATYVLYNEEEHIVDYRNYLNKKIKVLK